MRSKSDNIEIMINNEAGEVIEEFSKSFKSRYQNKLESMIMSMKVVIDYVYLLNYKCL